MRSLVQLPGRFAMLSDLNWTAWSAILVVAAMTFFSRMVGAGFMQAIKISPPVERFLDALSTSVIAALVASIAAESDIRTAIALCCAAATMLILRQSIWAILVGMVAAAAVSSLAIG